RGYLKDHADEVKSFLTAYQEAWTYAADPANKAGVIGVLAKYTQSDERLGEISYQAMIPIWTGNKTPRVNPQAVSNLLQVSGVPDGPHHPRRRPQSSRGASRRPSHQRHATVTPTRSAVAERHADRHASLTPNATAAAMPSP